MATENNEFMTAAATANGGEFSLLETGAYTGICVGLKKKEFKKYQSTQTEPKFQFVFQIAGDDGVNHYLQTVPYRNVIAEASKLYQFLSAWVGVSLEKASAGIDLGKLIGVKAQIVVGEAERDGKTFNTIENVLKAKKNDATEYVKDDKAPAWLNKGPFIAVHWIDGLGFAEAADNGVEFTDDDLVKEATAAKKATAPKKVDAKKFLGEKSEGDDEEGLPF